jgi:hypothetical protein
MIAWPLGARRAHLAAFVTQPSDTTRAQSLRTFLVPAIERYQLSRRHLQMVCCRLTAFEGRCCDPAPHFAACLRRNQAYLDPRAL